GGGPRRRLGDCGLGRGSTGDGPAPRGGARPTSTRLLERRQRPAVDCGDDTEGKRCDPVGLDIDAAQDLALDLVAQQPAAALALGSELADRDTVPADELGRRPRTLAGNDP